jgi:hypothetical protein
MERMFEGEGAMDETVREQAAVLALVRASPREWYRTADVIAGAGSALRLLGGAAAYAARPGVTVVDDPGDILVELAKVSQIAHQLWLGF